MRPRSRSPITAPRPAAWRARTPISIWRCSWWTRGMSSHCPWEAKDRMRCRSAGRYWRSPTRAARAGLRRGDLIVAADGSALHGVDDLYRALDGASAERELELTLVRGTDEQRVTVSLGEAR